MSETLDPSRTPVLRRRLITRGAVAAGAAAAGAVALGVAGAAPASAADGDALKQGGSFTGGTKTTTLGAESTANPVLRLANTKGPALELTSVGADFDGDLAPGQVVATDDRFVVGARDSVGSYTTALATVDDVNSLSLPFAIPPERLVDTRTAQGRANILNPGSLDSSGRLKAGAYIDVAVDVATSDYTVDAVYLNLTSTGSTGNGFLTACPPGPKPSASSLNFVKGVTIANFTLVRTGAVGDVFVVRIYGSALTQVVVDMTGALVTFLPGPAAARTQARTARRSAARRVRSWSPARRR